MTLSSTSAAQIVDVWAQPPLMKKNDLPEVRPLFKASSSPVLEWERKKLSYEEIADPSFMVSQMDTAGIDHALLCAWNRPQKVLISNDQILQYMKQYPNRFSGVVSIDLHNPVQACKDIEYYVKEHNFSAVRVVPWLWNKPLTHRYFYPLFVKCVELDIPFCTQVGHTGPLCPSEVGRPIPYIDRVALDFPDLKIVCGHIGYPWTDEMISVAWKHKNVFIDTSAYLPPYYPRSLVHFMSTYGRSKVMLGTNYPQLALDKYTKLVMSNEKLFKNKDFLYRNARRVFKLKKRNQATNISKL